MTSSLGTAVTDPTPARDGDSFAAWDAKIWHRKAFFFFFFPYPRYQKAPLFLSHDGAWYLILYLTVGFGSCPVLISLPCVCVSLFPSREAPPTLPEMWKLQMP